MEGKKLSIVTDEILERTVLLKKCVMESMTVGDKYIVRGITFFEEVLKEINPTEMNEEVINTIKMYINNILGKKDVRLNQYYLLGINKCYFIIYDYNYVHKKRKLV